MTVNDDTGYAFAKKTVEDLFGADRYTEEPHPELGSEDMSFVMELVPGVLQPGAAPRRLRDGARQPLGAGGVR